VELLEPGHRVVNDRRSIRTDNSAPAGKQTGAPFFPHYIGFIILDRQDRSQVTAMAKYHMNKAEREITDNSQLLEILERGKYATIAMCRDNEPYIVTMSFGYDPARHALYFHSAVKGRKLDIIAANPAVCATVIEDGGYLVNQCSHRYRSVVLDGNMHIVDDDKF
jgi:general stress protein 26